MQAAILILNFNGQDLLARCLPSVVAAAQNSRHDCRVLVIDNSSTDDSVCWLRENFPEIQVEVCPNRGLCSFNDVLPRLDIQVAILLNNDIQLKADCIDHLLAPFEGPHSDRRCFLTAPLLWQFDGRTYEGQKTAVAWRWGLVQATSMFEGHEDGIHVAGETACAGAALAVDRELFLQLGGFDPLYLPGRLEDLDLCFRAYQAGYACLHVPQAQGYHLGMATFAKYFAAAGCDYLALRNTLLFQWKNLRCWRHGLRQLAGIPLRLCKDLLQAAFVPRQRRWLFVRALRDAWRRRALIERYSSSRDAQANERTFFLRFSPQAMKAANQQEKGWETGEGNLPERRLCVAAGGADG